MSVRSYFWRVGLTFLIITRLFAGCVGKTPPVKFYRLKALQKTPEKPLSNPGVAIVVGPVEIPEILNRSQIVTQTGLHAITIAEYHRWAGYLPEDFARVLAENLGVLLATDRVSIYSRKKSFDPAYRIVLDVHHFIGEFEKEVQLVALWTLKDETSKKPLVVKKSAVREQILSAGYEGLVAAQSRAISVLSQEIAESIRHLHEKNN